jgi:hypothetical protein
MPKWSVKAHSPQVPMNPAFEPRQLHRHWPAGRVPTAPGGRLSEPCCIAEWRRAVLGIGEPNHSLQTGTSQGVEISLHVVQIRLSDGAADKSFQIKQPQNKRDILGLTVAEKSAPIKKRVERGVSFGVAVEPALGIGKQVISGRVADDRALTVIVV